MSAIRADNHLFFTKIISPVQKSSAWGWRADVNFGHCRLWSFDTVSIIVVAKPKYNLLFLSFAPMICNEKVFVMKLF